MLWPEELVAITPDTIISTTRYIQNILPVYPSFSFLYSGSGSFHRVSYQTNNRYFRLKKSYEMQQYADIYILLNYSACFRRPSCPSSGVHKTVVAASGTDHTIWEASFFKRDQMVTFEEACLYTHTHTYIYTHIHTYIHTYIHTHIHAYKHTCTRTYTHTNTCT